MHVGMWGNHLLQENDVADAAMEFASKNLMAGWKPAAALHLEESAENALVEVDYPLLYFGQDFGMRVAAFRASKRDATAAGRENAERVALARRAHAEWGSLPCDSVGHAWTMQVAAGAVKSTAPVKRFFTCRLFSRSDRAVPRPDTTFVRL
jgi:hypothetical protein